jgi:molybdate transport system substrate-binding protein
MKLARFLSLGVLLAGLLVSSAAPVSAQSNSEVTVFAAASLTDAFNEIASEFQYENPGTKVTFNFGGSNTLRAQLDQGASADVFASADSTQMDMARQNGDVSGDPQVFAHNLLTIITPVDNPRNVQGVCDLAKPGLKLVTAQPSVPVGVYTQTLLQNASNGECGAGFADAVNANTVSQEADVRQLVAKVQLGEADAGVSYLTDVTPQVRGQLTEVQIPDGLNTLATYPIATTKGNNTEGGPAFVNFVLSPIGQAILARWGFLSA